jgi:hypothetical protein
MMNARKWFATFSSILISLYCFTATAGSQKAIQFPGEISQIASPNGRYVLVNVDSESEEQTLYLGDNHALYLRDLKTGKEKKIYAYGRHVKTLWSPKGTRLMISDYGGSDYANCIIFFFETARNPINVQEQLREKMRYNKSVFGNHHTYIVGTEWFSENKVKIKIFGHGDIDPHGFTLWYEYLIGDGFKKLGYVSRELP